MSNRTIPGRRADADDAQAADAPRSTPPPNTAMEEYPEDVQVKLTRRSFITWVTASGVAIGHLRESDAAEPARPPMDEPQNASAPAVEGAVRVRLNVNQHDVELALDPRTTLLDCLRENLSLTGTKKGCDHGQCGACTVHVNGRRVNACLSLAIAHQGDRITTIEGLGQPGNLHPMQQAFVDHDGYQCGYCTSGQIMSGAALLHESWGPADADVKEAMSGNLCRCGAYKNIVAAIQQVRRKA